MADQIREEASALLQELVEQPPSDRLEHLRTRDLSSEVLHIALELSSAVAEGQITEVIEQEIERRGGSDEIVTLLDSPFLPADGVETTPAERGYGEKYPRQRELGRGGMGAVYEVWDQSIERPLAMKMLLKGRHSMNSPLVARFLKEAQITGQIDHPGVVPVHEIARDALGRVYFTMQVVDGMSLEEILALETKTREEEGWRTTRLLDVILKVCETLAYAHSKGFVHRDLKPANVMVGQFGETYVMDWGLAKRMQDEEEEEWSEPVEVEDDSIQTMALTQAGAVMGTPAYMSPEQAAGKIGEVDFASDIYSVGAMLYQILAGSSPYADQGIKLAREVLAAAQAGPPTKLERLTPGTSSELIAITEKAMRRVAQDRYQSMATMGDDVRAYLENRVVRAYRTGAWAEFTKWVRRNRWAAGAAMIAVLIAISGLAAVNWVQKRRNEDLAKANEATEAALILEKQAHRRTLSHVLERKSSGVLDENPASAL